MACVIQKEYPNNDVKIIEHNGISYRLVSEESVKGKYSISAKYNDVFVLKELFDKDNDLVWREVIDIIVEYRALIQKMIDSGVSPKSATAKAKKTAFDVVQARLIDEVGKDAYLQVFPMVDKSKAKSTKQRKREQVREVNARIKEIKKLSKELTLPPEVTQPDEDIVTQINSAISEDDTLKALKDTRDIEALKENKANIELPDIEVNINTLTFDNNPSEMEFKEQVKTSEVKEVFEENSVIVDDDLESFFDSCDGFF